jgi:hypothetical protein
MRYGATKRGSKKISRPRGRLIRNIGASASLRRWRDGAGTADQHDMEGN